MDELQKYLVAHADGDLISWAQQLEMMKSFNLSYSEAEEAILTAGFLPARYQRNRQMLSSEQQLQLFRSKVAVIGCGGLGGYILEELARLGIGQIVAVDPDIFEEHNLNRQLLSLAGNLGQSKVRAAVQRMAEINPALTAFPEQTAFTAEHGRDLLQGADIVVDAVDNVGTRLELGKCCCDLGIPLVHGAIAGWFGHVATIFPGEETLQKIYQHWPGGKGVEAQLGNPSFTPALVSSIEVAEVCKVLLGLGEPLRNRNLMINLRDMVFEEIQFERDPVNRSVDRPCHIAN